MVVYRSLGYERVYLPLHKVVDTPFIAWQINLLNLLFEGEIKRLKKAIDVIRI